MLPRVPAVIFLGSFLALSSVSAWGQGPGSEPDVRIGGTISTKPLLTALVRAIKEEKGLRIAISTDYTSVDVLDALAQDKVGIAIITKPLSGEMRALYPDLVFDPIPIGMDAVALGVSNDLWEAGVHSITKETMRAIYEQKITNWKKAGGPDEKITLFNFTQGAGIWETFAEWLYGDNRKAPLPKVEKVATSEDARDALEFTPGSISPIAAGLADGARCHALAVLTGTNSAQPTPREVAADAYPIVHPLIAVVIGQPNLAIRAVTEFLTGPAGQALIKKSGALGLDAVPKPHVDSEY